MPYSGTIQRVVRTGSTLTLILETEIGPRGVALERPEWQQLLQQAGADDPQALVGWEVDYDPAHDRLELLDPDRAADEPEWPDGSAL